MAAQTPQQYIDSALAIEREYNGLVARLSGLSVSPVQALILLKIEGEIPLGRLGRGSVLSYHVAELTSWGYLSRTQDGRDRRASILRLTQKGRDARGAVVACLENVEAA